MLKTRCLTQASMCYHIALLADQFDDFVDYFDIPGYNKDYHAEIYQKTYHVNGFTKPYIPVIRPRDGSVVIDCCRWGLIPHWVSDTKRFKANTLNARNDELFDKPSYRSYWRNRCLVIVSGFFEPRDRKLAGLPEPASKLQKTESWFIKHATEPFLTLGGIYCNDTVAIITTDASPLLEQIHNDGKRMPLILNNEDLRDRWLLGDLDQKEMARLMATHPDDTQLEAFRTIDGIMNNRIDTNVPEAVLPLSDP